MNSYLTVLFFERFLFLAYRSVSYAADNFQSDSRRIEYRTVAKESCNNRNDPGSELMLLILSYISIPGQNLQAVGVSYTSSNRSTSKSLFTYHPATHPHLCFPVP